MVNERITTRRRRYLFDLRVGLIAALATAAQLQTANVALAQDRVASDPEPSVRLFADRSVTDLDSGRVLRVSERLLAPTGVRPAWHDCIQQTNCVQPMGDGFHVAVLIRRVPVSPVKGRCAVGARNPRGAGGAVLVDYDCVADVVHRLRMTPIGRANPLVATVDESDLIGLAIAHEIGHLAGLRHAGTGVMRARVDPEAILSLRQQSLTFAAREAATLRRAMAAPDVGTLASTRVP
jgi:hypothetical protein